MAGAHDFDDLSGNEQLSMVSEKFIPTQFSDIRYDICILHLSSPFEFNEFISAISLPEELNSEPEGILK